MILTTKNPGGVVFTISPELGTHVFFNNKRKQPACKASAKKQNIMGNWISEIVGGGLGLINSGINIAAAKKENEKNRQWQEQMYNLSVENNRQDAETAYGRQLELLAAGRKNQLQYQLEEPSAKLQGLKNAGINLALGLNGGAAGGQGVGSVSAAQAAPAGYGNPTTFLPQIMDLSTAMKNFAEAGLAKAQAKKEEGLTEKIQDERQAIQQSISESQAKVKEILSKERLNKAQESYTKMQSDWQEIQNRIANATEKEQEELIRQQTTNAKKEWEKMDTEINNSNKTVQQKEELKDSMIKLQNQQLKNLLIEAYGKKLENGKQLQTFKSYCDQAAETARKLKAEAENAEDFKRRFDKEMENKAIELGINERQLRTKNIWSTVTNAYYDIWNWSTETPKK